MRRTIILDPADMPAPVEALPEPAKEELVKPIGQPIDQSDLAKALRELQVLRDQVQRESQVIKTGRAMGKSTAIQMPHVKWEPMTVPMHAVAQNEYRETVPPAPLTGVLQKYTEKLVDDYFHDALKPIVNTLGPGLLTLAMEKISGKTSDNPGGK